MQVAGMSAIYWRTGPEYLSLSTCFLSPNLARSSSLSSALSSRTPGSTGSSLSLSFHDISLHVTFRILVSAPPGGVTPWSPKEGLVSSTRQQGTLGLGLSVN